MAEFIALPGSLLKPGVPLPFSVFNSRHVLLLGKGCTVKDDVQCAAFQRMELRGLKAELAALYPKLADEASIEVAGATEVDPHRDLNPFDEVGHWFHRAQLFFDNEDNAAARLESLADSIAEGVLLFPDAAIAGMFLIPFKNYTAAHGVHCAILAAYLQLTNPMPQAEFLALMQALLAMNLSIHQLQDKLFKTPGKVTESCRRLLDNHPMASIASLKSRGIENTLINTIIAQHHEKEDGSGYPHRCVGSQIHPLARFAQALDVIAARLTHRSYRNPLAPPQALGKIIANPDSAMSLGIAQRLVKALGMYPPGTFVHLANGELGICVAPGPKLNAPVVKVLLNPDGQARAKPVVRNVLRKELAIDRVVPYTDLLGKFTALNNLFGFSARLTVV